MRNHDLVSNGFLTLTVVGLVLLCSSLLAFYLLKFWTRTFNRTSAPLDGIRSDCARTTIPCNALHSTSAENSGSCRSGPSAVTSSAKAARRAVGVSSLANLIFVGKTNIAS